MTDSHCSDVKLTDYLNTGTKWDIDCDVKVVGVRFVVTVSPSSKT